MSDPHKTLVRNAREQDIPAVAEIDAEAYSPYGTAEKPETFQLRLKAFPNCSLWLFGKMAERAGAKPGRESPGDPPPRGKDTLYQGDGCQKEISGQGL
jgi:hypothetical protein